MESFILSARCSFDFPFVALMRTGKVDAGLKSANGNAEGDDGEDKVSSGVTLICD